MKISASDLVNRNESRVLKEVEAFVKSGQTRNTCLECQLDLAALSLNRIPPRYIVDSYANFGEPVPDRPSDQEIAQMVKLMARVVEKNPHKVECELCRPKKT